MWFIALCACGVVWLLWGHLRSRFWEGVPSPSGERRRENLPRSQSIIPWMDPSFRPTSRRPWSSGATPHPAPLPGPSKPPSPMAARRSDAQARGERMRVGPIDPRCVSPTNAPPDLTAEQAAARTWRPDAGDVARHPAALRVRPRHPANHRVRGGQSAAGGLARTGDHPHFQRPGGRAHLLPRRAADALRNGEGRDQAAGRQRHSADRLAPAQRRREQQSPADGRHPQLRQLPLVLARRQDAGHGCRRAAERQGAVRPGGRQAPDDHPQGRRDRLEHVPRETRRQTARRLHVAGIARWTEGGDHDQRSRRRPARLPAPQESAGPDAELLRGQFQGLPLPAGLLSDARHSRVVRPGDRPVAASARRRRPALRADRRGLESGRQVPGVRARPGPDAYPRRRADGRVRQRSERDPRFNTTSTAFPSTTGRAGRPSRSRAHRQTA